LPTLLIDHAHCEKKAASTAVRFLFKYPEWDSLCAAMGRLGREELLHFDLVRRELHRRGVSFRGLSASGYAAALFGASEPTRLDEMICCALIEARSHERFLRLAAAAPDAGLRSFYARLAEAEARHGDVYLALAAECGAVDARLAALVAAEGEIVARPGLPLRMHSGG
jgi:tRNA-(ms[2]io[6]A)-hydroxylase